MDFSMKTTMCAVFGIAGVMLLMAAGCTRPTTLGPDYGLAQRMARDSQILNPQASANLEPLYTLDGQSATLVMQRYRDRFKSPEQFRATVSIPSLVTTGVQTD